jgi:hypothetical protein
MLELHENLKSLIVSDLDYSQMLLEMPLKQLVSVLKDKVLVLLKLMLLEKKIIIYSRTASVVSTFIMSLCSLIPGLLTFGGACITSNKIHTYLVSLLTNAIEMPRNVWSSFTSI